MRLKNGDASTAGMSSLRNARATALSHGLPTLPLATRGVMPPPEAASHSAVLFQKWHQADFFSIPRGHYYGDMPAILRLQRQFTSKNSQRNAL